MYEVVLSQEAQRIYASAELALAKKIAHCLEQLQQTPRTHPNIKALKGRFAGHYRYRIGDYRLVYSLDDAAKRALVVTIAH